MKTISISLDDKIYEELSEMLDGMGQTKQTFYESFTRTALRERSIPFIISAPVRAKSTGEHDKLAAFKRLEASRKLCSGRREQFATGACHACVGADKAYRFLIEHDFPENFAAHVRECILTHRYRRGNQPGTIEAKILFDADKVDVTGAVGIARTLVYKGQVAEPLYTVLPDGQVSDGTGDVPPSFFQEYKYKLEGLYDKFYTKRGAEIAGQRRQAAVDFYNGMLREVSGTCENGNELLREVLD